jgi:hypothetical protein
VPSDRYTTGVSSPLFIEDAFWAKASQYRSTQSMVEHGGQSAKSYDETR